MNNMKTKTKKQPIKVSPKPGRNTKVIIETPEGVKIVKYKNIKNEDFGKKKPFNKLLQNVKSSAKPPSEKGLGERTSGRTEAREVTITAKDLEEIFNEQKGVSPLSGVPLDLNELYIPGSLIAPSVDRKKNEGGYTRDNVWIVTRGENKGRGDGSIQDARDWVAAIQEADAPENNEPNYYFNKPNYNKIFNEPLEDVISERQHDILNVFQGPMNIGKTFFTFNGLIPRLMEEGVKCFWYSAPMKDLISRMEFQCYITEVQLTLGKPIQLLLFGSGEGFNNPGDIKKFVDMGQTVVCASTDAYLFETHLDDEQNRDYLLGLGDKFSYIRDEIHWGSTSADKFYRKNMGGGNGSTYRARFFKGAEMFMENTPWVFGFTATPTLEMTDDEFGTDKYVIRNEWTSPHQMTGVSSWIGGFNTTFHNKSKADEDYVKDALHNIVWAIENRTRTIENIIDSHSSEHTELLDIETLITGLIAVENTYNGGNPERVYLDKVLRLLLDVQFPSDFDYLVNTEAGYKVYDGKTHQIKEKGKGDWVDIMNDETNNVKLAIVVATGTMGVNIPTLCEGLVFRNPSMKNEDGWVTRNPRQFVGRFLRKNWGEMSEELIQELPYEISSKLLRQLNSVNITVPDTPQWRETKEQIMRDYATDTENVVGFGYSPHRPHAKRR